MEAKQKKVSLCGNSDDSTQATLSYTVWSKTEVQARAIKRTAKVFGIGAAACLVILFIPLVHWSLLVLAPGLFIATGILYKKFLDEGSNFECAEGTCPHCKEPSKMGPYTNSKLQSEVKLLCPECGQSCTAS